MGAFLYKITNSFIAHWLCVKVQHDIKHYDHLSVSVTSQTKIASRESM